MRRLLFSAATACVASATSVALAEPPAAIVVDVAGGTLDPAHVRAAVGRELGMQAVGPDDPRATTAAGALRIEARPAAHTLTVTYRKSGAAGVVTRTVALPAKAEATAVILAGNLARDEAGELLAGLARPKAAAPPTPIAPPPTPQEAAALGTLGAEVSAFEDGAKAYRDLVTTIVRLHYEAKKKDVLSGLDRELAIEKAEAKKARETAIRRLEQFLDAYRGPGASVEIADALFRLAALYEERARADDAPAPLEEGLKDAVRVYERLVREHPTYGRLADVHYFLGHALADSGRTRDAQRVWRSLVCHDRFGYPDAKPAPQDAEERRHSGYVEIYPDDCVALGANGKYVPEVWWQIGNWEFDQLDTGAGPWGYNRAASAYRRAMKGEKAPIFGVALYKYAWTLFKQQRYEAATRAFVRLLVAEGEREGVADFRDEAITYIAGSLVHVDFVGPAASDPFVARPDDGGGESALHVAIDRVKNAALIPQDKPWTVAIYRALAAEYRGLGQSANAIEVYDTMLRRWPMDASAPETQNAIAETWDEQAAMRAAARAMTGAPAAKATEARTKLARYVGSTPWVDANKDNPSAIHQAERLARAGLKGAAARHTNDARAAAAAADAASDGAQRLELLSRAVAEYTAAEEAWRSWPAPPDDPRSAYECRYWAADALHKAVHVRQRLHELAPKTHGAPSAVAIDAAIAAARTVRDSTDDDRFVDNAGFFVVDLVDVARDLAYEAGTPRRAEVALVGTDPATREVAVDAIPASVQRSLDARDEYARVVPRARDAEGRVDGYRYYVAETYFLYGQWLVASERFAAMWREHCGVDGYGFRAWEKLVTMAALSRDEDAATRLADAVDPGVAGGRSCDAAGEARYTGRIRAEVGLAKARRKLEEACEAPLAKPCRDPGAPRKASTWREAAALYERALEAGAVRDDASEAAMNAAFAHRQLGENARAIALYERVVRDDAAPAKVAADAYDALASVYFSVFDHLRTAATYDRLAASPRFDAPRRRVAAKNALVLYAALGDKGKATSARDTLARLAPAAEEKAAADYTIAAFDYALWQAGGAGARQAEAQLVAFYRANGANAGAGPQRIAAAYAVAKMKRALGEPDQRAWLASTVAAWDELAARDRAAAQRPPYVDYAAEAAFTLVDEDIGAKFDAADVHAYPARTPEIFARYRINAEQARRWDSELETKVVEKYPSTVWIPAAIARQGAVFDRLRAGLYDTTKPRLFDAAGERLVATLRASGKTELVDRADRLEDAARDFWRTKKQQELDGADARMVQRYASAIAYGRTFGVKSAPVDRALARLATYTELLGDAKLRAWVSSVPDPAKRGASLAYTDGMYAKARPGVVPVAAPENEASPLPAAP